MFFSVGVLYFCRTLYTLLFTFFNKREEIVGFFFGGSAKFKFASGRQLPLLRNCTHVAYQPTFPTTEYNVTLEKPELLSTPPPPRNCLALTPSKSVTVQYSITVQLMTI